MKGSIRVYLLNPQKTLYFQGISPVLCSNLMYFPLFLTDSYRSKAGGKSHERNPLTETADRQRKTAAMVLPIHGGIHSLISVPAFE